MLDISIITTAHENTNGLGLTLQSLKPLLSSGLAWEHVIVDSSPEYHEKILQDSAGIWPRTYVTCTSTEPYASKNLGWRRAGGKLFLFLAAGERLRDMESLVACVAYFKKDSRCDILLTSADKCRVGKTVEVVTPHPSFVRNLLGVNRLCSAQVIYRGSSFERVGEFSSRYKSAGEYEHLFRCHLAGFKHQSTRRRLVQIDLDQGAGAIPLSRQFDEYEKIHESLASRLPPQIAKLNHFILAWEKTKMEFSERSLMSIAADKSAALRRWFKK